MKTNLLIVFTLITFITKLQSQIVIYDFKGSATAIGGRSSLSTTAIGNLAWDLNTNQATYIGLITFSSGKNKFVYFQETPLENFVITQIYAPKNITYTVHAKAEAPGTQFAGVFLEQAQATGINSSNTIQTSPKLNWILPKSLSSSGFVITEAGNYDYLGQSTGTYTLNSKLTISSNNSGISVNTYISSLRNYYTQKGYQEYVLTPAQ